MALIPCPECHNQMSDTAPACPKCGWARAVVAGQYPGYPPPGYAQAPAAKKGVPGWVIAILVLLGVFVVLGGALVVLAVAGTRKYIAAAKTAEARSALGQIARDAATSFEAEEPEGLESSDPPQPRRLCASATQPVPANVSFVRGRKYQSSATDWTVDEKANAGFACLKFSMNTPQYFQYAYTATSTGKPGDKFVGSAVGDLDGDGITSRFEIRGAVASDDTLHNEPEIVEDKPEE